MWASGRHWALNPPDLGTSRPIAPFLLGLVAKVPQVHKCQLPGPLYLSEGDVSSLEATPGTIERRQGEIRARGLPGRGDVDALNALDRLAARGTLDALDTPDDLIGGHTRKQRPRCIAREQLAFWLASQRSLAVAGCS